MRRLWIVLMAVLSIGVGSSVALAQSGTTRTALSGTVLDTDGGALPGATVEVKNARTGVVIRTVTSSTGIYDVPAIDAGMYVITVSLSGFKTSVLTDVELLSGAPRSVNVTLQIGGVTEAIEVRGGSQLVQTQATAVTSVVRVDQIANLPLITRNSLNFVPFLPGVDTSSSNHSQRSSTVAGLPQSSLSLTVDGANIQDKYTRSTDGFFANIHPKLDLIEEISVSSATATADSSGQGAVQIKFVTRSGTNQFTGSAYEYARHRALNTNYYFNEVNELPKNQLTLNQWGFREGGPIVLPGYDGRGKAFFFFNFEQLRFPLSNTRNRGLLTENAQNGLFSYPVAGGATQTVNILAVAASQNQISTPDPTIVALLAKIHAGAVTTGRINTRTDLNTLEYLWQPDSLRIDNSPGGRVDFNLSTKHRLSISYNYQGQRLNPNLFGGDEPNFPGLANEANLYSAVSRGSVMLRSTLGSHLVNELRWGLSNAPVWFADEVDFAQFDDQAGFNLGFPGIGAGITNATTNAAPSSRNGKSWNVDNTVNWLRGSHSVSFGANFSRIAGWTKAQTLVAGVNLGFDTTNDPANSMFTTQFFPGAAQGDLTNARNLYALLTGRVTSINSNVRLDGDTGKYVYLGVGQTSEQQDELGLFIQDSWRVRPNLTLNGGLRWQVAFPFKPNDSVYSMNTMEDACGVSGLGNGPGGRECNIFNPGVFNAGGRNPVYELYNAGNPGYNTEYDNFAPNIGVAWQPNVKDGWLRNVLGDPELATIRASLGISYNSDGLSFYTGIYGANPGNQITTNRTATSTQFPLVPPGESWPVLLRTPERLGASAGNPAEPIYPMPINFNSGVNLFHPDYRTPYAKSFSAGIQRPLSRLMSVEVRYVGTRLTDGTTTEDWNEVNWRTNGFYEEFLLAQQNLQSHLAAGCGQAGAAACSFAYRGPGTNQLPIYLAAFNAQPASAAGNQALYTGANWTNNARLGELAARNPNPSGAANTLFSTAGFRTNMGTAGYASNFFVLNPAVSGVSIRTNGEFTKYDSLQIIVRRALSQGLAFDANYVWAKRYASRLESLLDERTLVRSTAGVPHALKLTAMYQLPFGRGQRYGTDWSGWMDGAAGGWSLNLTARVQSGTVLNFGNVNVVGMTQDQLRDAFKIRIDEATDIVYTLPQDIIDNTIKAFSISATSATGYGALGPPEGRYLAPANGPDCIQVRRGDCAPADVFVQGPIFTRFDLNVKKRFPIGSRKSFDVGVDIMNLFDAINFNAVAQAGSGANINQVTQAYQDPNVTFDPGGRLMQLVFRFNF
jgi:hypothetical protein